MKRALSLIEVLVTITILIILASLLFPAFQGARDKAKGTVCTSNLRQLHTALTLYRDDCGEYPPNSVVWPGFTAYFPTVLRCPLSSQIHPDLDYTLLSGPVDGRSGAQLEAWEACRRARGPMLPIALDRNHWTPTRPSEGRLLVARENGSIHDLPSSRIPAEPCPEPFDLLNL